VSGVSLEMNEGEQYSDESDIDDTDTSQTNNEAGVYEAKTVG